MVRGQACQWALTHSGIWDGGSLEGGDCCLTQHLGELGHTLASDAVALETVSEEQSIHGERASVSNGL